MSRTRTAALILAFIFVFLGAGSAAAETYTDITTEITAQVVEIIDGDAIKVRLKDGRVALVQLVGVDAVGYNDAMQYLVSQIMGRSVQLLPEWRVDSSGRWNKMYVYLNNRLINSELLERGLAKTNSADLSASQYGKLSAAYNDGKANGLGQWAVDGSSSRIGYVGNGLNINTATATQISDILKDVSYSVAQRIVSYRQKNPFNIMTEIKFVQGFTKEMFDNNRSYLAVSTNVTTASREELSTLTNMTDTYVDRIIDYRYSNSLSNINQLLDKNLLTSSIYNSNLPFISVNSRATISYNRPEESVNINRASKEQLMGIGLSDRNATAIVDYRAKYSYKTLEELQHVPGISSSAKSFFDEWEDNLRVTTDINSAPRSEIESLFGSSFTASEISKIINSRPFDSTAELLGVMTSAKYEEIKPYVYLDTEPERKRVNINTCEQAALVDIGFTASQANGIINSREIVHGSNTSVNLSSLDSYVALYTNINKADTHELKSLDPSMSDSLVSSIISYRNDQPFGSLDEVSELFEQRGAHNVYNRINEYIVLR